ncbi:MAG: GAF domain-containing protein [Anaerolineae bacterium]|nr:GAF domain-containing protein [Anaerolineae bacterium]
MKDKYKSKPQLINELEQLRAELASEKILSRTLMDNMPDSIYVKDTKGRFVSANVTVARLMGVKEPEALVGRKDSDFLSPELATQFYKDEQKLFRTGQPLIGKEEINIYPTGDIRWVSTTKVPLKNSDGKVIGLVGINRDVTEIENERRLLRLLIDNMPDYIYVKDIESRFVIANQTAVERMKQNTETDLKGRTDFYFFPEKLAAKYFADEQEVIRTGAPIDTEEPIIDLRTGKQGWLSTKKVPLRDEYGRIVGIIGIGRDITQLKEIQETLEKRVEQLEALRHTTLAITSQLKLIPLLKLITQEAVKLLGSKSGSLYQYYPNRKEFELVATENPNIPIGFIVKESQGIPEQLFETQQSSLFIPNYRTWKHRIEILAEKGDLGAILAVPLKWQDKIIGTLYVEDDIGRVFDEQDANFLLLFATCAAVAIKNASLFEDLQRHIQSLDVVNDVARIINSQHDIKKLLQTVVEQVKKNLDCTHCTIFLAEQVGDEILLVPKDTHGQGRRSILGRRFKVGEGIAGEVFKTGKSRILKDARRAKGFVKARKKKNLPRSMLVAPIKIGERIIGVISADQDKFDWFDEAGRQFVDTLAGHVGIAIERTKSLNSGIVNNIVSIISLKLDTDELLQTIADQIAEMLDCRHCNILLAEQNNNETLLVSKAIYGIDAEQVKQRTFRPGEGIAGIVFAEKRSRIVDNTSDDPLFLSPQKSNNRHRSMLVAPITIGDRVIGVISADQNLPGWFDENGCQLVDALAGHIGIAIEINQLIIENKRLIEIRTELALRGMTNTTSRHNNRREAIKIRDAFTDVVDAIPEGSLMISNDYQERFITLQRIIESSAQLLITTNAETQPLDQNVARTVPIKYWLTNQEIVHHTKVRGYEIVLDLDGLNENTTLKVDPEWLSCAFQILIANAEKAMVVSATQCLTIIAQEIDRDNLRWVEIDFRDTGLGIPSQIRPLIFKERIVDPNDLNSGMGLLMVDLIIKTFNGKILLVSTSSTGTTFRVQLPVEAKTNMV